MTSNLTSLPTFSGDNLDYSKFRREILARATTSSTCCSEGYGLLGFLVPQAEWIRTLTAANRPSSRLGVFVPLVHPGDKPTAGIQFPSWKADLDLYLEQNKDVNKFKIMFRGSLDEESLAAIDSEDHDNAISLGHMMAILDGLYRTLAPSDLFRNKNKLLIPFQGATSIRVFISAQRRVHTIAQDNHFAFPETDKVSALTLSLSSFSLFQSCIDNWTMSVPTAAGQTFELLAAAIIQYSDNHDVSSPAANSYASQVAQVPSFGHVFTIEQQAAIARQIAASAQVVTTKTAQQQGSAKLYCWTHGFGGHSSVQCQRPAEGHEAAATGKNPLGGSSKGRRGN
jgi:hypothetical protein